MFSDSHTHVDGYSEDRLEQVLAGARAAGVELLVAASQHLESAARTVAIARRQPGVVPAVGIHPWNAVAIDDQLYRKLREQASAPEVVAISEIGLDFQRDMFRNRDLSNDQAAWEVQKQAFGEQVRLARELGLPIIVHCRGAQAAMLELLRQGGVPQAGGAIHGFAGDEAALKDWLELGFYISVGVRALTSPDLPALAPVFSHIPEQKLLLETDSDPSRVVVAAEKMAEATGKTAQEIGESTTANLKRLLRISP